MAKDYSPFTPGVPVPLEFFVGREKELSQILDRAGAAATGRVERVFIIGERGIGKSSLCQLVRIVSEKEHNLLGLHVHLGGAKSLKEVVHRTFERLLNDSIERAWYGRLKELFKKHIKEVDIFGVRVEFSANEADLEALVFNFADALRNILKEVGNGRKGLLLIFDDLDELAKSTEFANWLKSFIDGIATSGKPLPLLLILAGLPEQRVQMIAAQPSLARIFDIVEVTPLTEEETCQFFTQTFAKVGVEVEDAALKALYPYTAGYPALAQEIGDAIFKADTDDFISLSDVPRGVMNAVEIVGRKYIEPQVYAAMKSGKYRSILDKLSYGPHGVGLLAFKRKDIAKLLEPGEEKVLDNFLKKMTDLGVLDKDQEHGLGAYKFAKELHFIYFWLKAKPDK